MIYEALISLLTLYGISYSIKQKPSAYVIGLIIMTLNFFFYFKSGSYSQCFLRFSFIPFHIYGWWFWRKEENMSYESFSLSFTQFAYYSMMVTTSPLLFYFFIKIYIPALGGFFSLHLVYILVVTYIAQWMTIKKYVEAYWLWSLINLLQIYDHFLLRHYFIMGKYIIYLFFSIYTLQVWGRITVRQQ